MGWFSRLFTTIARAFRRLRAVFSHPTTHNAMRAGGVAVLDSLRASLNRRGPNLQAA